MFVNRVKELKTLEDSLKLFRLGNKMPIAIIGLRRIGKTELIQKFRENRRGFLMPYLNLQGTMSSPETFVQDFYITLLEEITTHKKISSILGGTKRERIIALSSSIGKDVYGISMEFLNTVESKDYNETIKFTFRLPQTLSDHFGKIIFFLDEFQELEALNNYKFGDVFKIMRSVVEKQKDVMYVISGSIISFMERLVRGSREPFFNQFRILNLSYFTKEDSLILINKMLKGYRIGDKALLTLFKQTLGHPFYITAVCERLIIESMDVIDENLVKYAVLKESIDKNGKINILFKYIFEESLKKAKRRGHLQNILLILAENEGLNLTRISELLKKPTGQVSNYMKSLLKTDLIFPKDKKYFYRDPLFRFWVAKTQLGKDIEIEKSEKCVEDYINELKERYLRTSTDLGIAKESEIREILKNKFHFKPEPYIKGGIEFDAVGFDEGVCHIFEIKWRNKPVNYRDVKNFLDRIERSEFSAKEKKMFFVSKSGFTDNAKRFASKYGIELMEINK